MKKLLTLILAFVVCFGVVSTIGCGGSGSANFREITAEEFRVATQNIDSNEDVPFMIGIENGINFHVDEKGQLYGSNYNESYDVKLVKVGNSYEFIHVQKSTDAFFNIDQVQYFKDDFCYYLDKSETVPYKWKMPYPFEDTLYQFIYEYESYIMTFDEAEYLIEANSTAKYYIDDSGNTTKLKVDIKTPFANNTETTTVIYEVDENNAIISYSLNYKGIQSQWTVSLTTFSGTLDFPSDLDSYELIDY